MSSNHSHVDYQRFQCSTFQAFQCCFNVQHTTWLAYPWVSMFLALLWGQAKMGCPALFCSFSWRKLGTLMVNKTGDLFLFTSRFHNLACVLDICTYTYCISYTIKFQGFNHGISPNIGISPLKCWYDTILSMGYRGCIPTWGTALKIHGCVSHYCLLSWVPAPFWTKPDQEFTRFYIWHVTLVAACSPLVVVLWWLVKDIRQ